MMTQTTSFECSEVFTKLNEPFPFDVYEINYDGYAYIGPQAVIDRMNSVFGLNWEMTTPEYEIDKENFQVYCKMGITVHLPDGRKITRYQSGSNVINTLKDDKEKMTKEAIGDSVKSACSDALKKCASLFGCAADLYHGEIGVVKSTWSNYIPAKTKAQQILGLSDFDTQSLFEKGVYFLPDKYRSFYDQKGWKGVFKSDLFGSRSSSTENEQPSNQPNRRTNENQNNENPKKVTKNQVDKLFKKMGEQKGLSDEQLLREVKIICPYIQKLEDVFMTDKDKVLEHLKTLSKVELTPDAVEILRQKAQQVQAPDSFIFGLVNRAFELDETESIRSWNEMKGLQNQEKLANLSIPRSHVLIYQLYQTMNQQNYTEQEIVESYNAYASKKGLNTFDSSKYGLRTLQHADLSVLEEVAASLLN